MGDIVPFPNRFFVDRRYRIPLYSDGDIDLVLFCINAFGETENRVMLDDLLQMDPIDVMKCLDFALESDIVGNAAKQHIQCIRNSVEIL